MKAALAFSIGLLAFSSAQAKEPPTCVNTACIPQNIEVAIFGKEMAPKAEDDRAVRNVIGSLVRDLKVQKYILKGVGIEGGFSACLEARDSESFENMLQALNGITVDLEKTVYTMKIVNHCETEDKK